MVSADSGMFARLESKLDRVSGDLGTVREQLAGMSERFAPRGDVANLNTRIALLERDNRRLMAVVGGALVTSAGSVATVLAPFFSG